MSRPNHPPLVDCSLISECFIREWERYGPGYPGIIAGRMGYYRMANGNREPDVAPVMRRVKKRGFIREDTAKALVTAMGYDPVDFDF